MFYCNNNYVVTEPGHVVSICMHLITVASTMTAHQCVSSIPLAEKILKWICLMILRTDPSQKI